MESFFLLLRVLVSLAAVFGLLFYLRKRLLPRFGTPRAAQLALVERRNLGPKSSVVLLDVAGRRYLLGVAESSISVLDSFEAPEPPPAPAVESAQAVAGSGTVAERSRAFAQSLLNVRPGAVSPHDPEAVVPTEVLPADAPHPDASQPAAPHPGTERPAGAVSVPGVAAGPLAGSILSPDTWRRAAAALRPGRGA